QIGVATPHGLLQVAGDAPSHRLVGGGGGGGQLAGDSPGQGLDQLPSHRGYFRPHFLACLAVTVTFAVPVASSTSQLIILPRSNHFSALPRIVVKYCRVCRWSLNVAVTVSGSGVVVAAGSASGAAGSCVSASGVGGSAGGADAVASVTGSAGGCSLAAVG